ncbi:MAG: SH3 domain-containing protein [Burkholderiaceae bacterium]|jgi:uncharacterized protein YraI|nr:SH3 domain-containing protein [Burkholderiaceae bacterium]
MASGQIKSWIRNAALVAAIAMPLAAAAQQAVVSAGGNLRAGPDRTYPLVAQLAPGTPATVMGCVSSYSWCDVVVPGGVRGWLSGGRLGYAYQGVPVPLLSIGAMIGVPIITFSLDSYWGNYYRDRPWYSQPRWWGGRRPPSMDGWRRPPPPAATWRPHEPPARWHPPGVRPNEARPAARPSAARPQQEPGRRPPERRRDDSQDNRR